VKWYRFTTVRPLTDIVHGRYRRHLGNNLFGDVLIAVFVLVVVVVVVVAVVVTPGIGNVVFGIGCGKSS